MSRCGEEAGFVPPRSVLRQHTIHQDHKPRYTVTSPATYTFILHMVCSDLNDIGISEASEWPRTTDSCAIFVELRVMTAVPPFHDNTCLNGSLRHTNLDIPGTVSRAERGWTPACGIRLRSAGSHAAIILGLKILHICFSRSTAERSSSSAKSQPSYSRRKQAFPDRTSACVRVYEVTAYLRRQQSDASTCTTASQRACRHPLLNAAGELVNCP